MKPTNTFKSFITSPNGIIAAVSAVALIAVAIVFITNSSKPQNQYVTVTRGNVVEAVTAPGTVKAAESIDLAFLKGGRISSVNVQAGDTVKAGQTLVTIDSADVYAGYQQAQAMLESQQAKLTSLQTGARPEVIGLDQTSITSANSQLAQAEQSIVSSLQDAYNKSDDAIHNKADELFTNGRSSNPTFNYNLNNQQLGSSLQSDRASLELTLANWQKDLAVLGSNPNATQLTVAITEGKTNIALVNSFLVEMGTAVNSITTANNSNLSQSTIDTYKTNITLARTNVSAASSVIISTAGALDTANSALNKANQQLALDQAGGSTTDLAAEQAQVDAAEASVNNYAAQLSQTVIRAPIDGIITNQNAHVGQIASPSATLVSMNSNSKFQVEIYVSEADIAKVKVGNQADITLDAYSGMSPLTGAVIAVDPAATIQNGSPSYKVTLQFNDTDDRIKAGLTANVTISAGSQQSALVVPQSAIITEGTSKFVLKKNGNTATITPVQVGIADQSGSVEIISGLNEGDQVAAYGNVTIK